MVLVIARRNGYDFFTEEAIRRNRHFGITRDFRPLFQLHSHIDAVAGRFHAFDFADVDADIADGIALLKAIGIFKFRMDDEARLAEDFSMGQGQDDKGKDEDADDGDQADLRFCTPLHRLSPLSSGRRPPWIKRCTSSSCVWAKVFLSAMSRKRPSCK